MTTADDGRAELNRVRRVADMLCTTHAGLAEDYARQALVFDVGLLVLSAWVASLAFVDPSIAVRLVPPGLTPTIWTGLMGVTAFVLTMVQMRLDLRGRADAHRRTFSAYAEVKRDIGQLLAMAGEPDPAAAARVLTQHGFAASVGVGVPEAEFLKRKQLHLVKVRDSRFLDTHPSASLRLYRLKMWWADNVQLQNSATDAQANRAIKRGGPQDSSEKESGNGAV